MTDLLARVASIFVEPASAPRPARAHRVAITRPAPCVGVVAAPRHALAVGATVALAVAHASRARRALVCAWPPGGWAEPVGHAPAGVGARQLRRSLAARDVAATASGKLVRVVLPEAPEEAALAADRATAAASAPTVFVLAGPRPEVLDELLLRQDAVVVAAEPEADPSLVDLAVASLHDRHPVVTSCVFTLGPVGRALAAAGVAAPLGSSHDLAPVLEAVG